MSKWVGCLLSALVWLVVAVPTWAEEWAGALSVSSLQVPPGGHLIVPVDLATTEPLTLLAFDFVYWPIDEFCSALADPNGIAFRAAGRTLVLSEEDSTECERGRIRVVFFDLIGDTVIPPGTGPVAEIVFGSIRPGSGHVFHLGIQGIEASSGPVLSTIANLTPPGMCEWACPPENPDQMYCWWACRACLPGEACEDPATLTIGQATPTKPRPQAVRCCAAADTCRFADTAEECEAGGGLNLGPGSCDPDPCAGATAPPPAAAELCAAAATDASVTCRLGELIAMARHRSISGTKLLGSLLRAERRIGRAQQLRESGHNGSARRLLRRAVGDLRVFRARLRSRRGGRLVDVQAETAMLGLADPLRVDLRALSTRGR